MSPEVKEILDMLTDAWKQSGGNWKLLLPFIPVALVNLYKLSPIQSLVASKWPQLAWDALPTWAQMLLALVLGSLPVLGANLIMGTSALQSIVLALGAGVAAVLGFKPMKAAATPTLGKVLTYVPDPLLRATSIVVPLDVAKLQAEKEARLAAK